ncbi:MAG: AAA family ATPase [Desulfococcaceae bacterium]
MNRLPTLPIGKSSFESIREKNDLYVDKTRHIFELVDRGEYYFLSRPRRFGKSLTVSTLKCLFEGKRELFEGLWIAQNTDWEWKEHPVVVLDFNEIPHRDPETLRNALSGDLQLMADRHGIPLKTDYPETRLKELIVGLRDRFGAGAVFLVDEYDKPLVSHLGKGEEALEIAQANRDVMKGFFGVLKGAKVAPCLRFVFFTGVSKFSRVSIFSELSDITMNRRYAGIMGYTQAEVELNFAPYIAKFAQETGQDPKAITEDMRVFYNGYRFSEEDVRVYHPFSVLKALDEMAFKHYWLETGIPTFAMNLLKKRYDLIPQLENFQCNPNFLNAYDMENPNLEAILFQSGCLTIKDIGESTITLGYPNREVKAALTGTLLSSLLGGSPTFP